MKKILFFAFAILFFDILNAEVSDETWQQDLSSNMKIGLTYKGFTRAVLECSEEWMAFTISTDQSFKGVVYPRGQFHTGKPPCFLDANGGTDFALKMPLDKCGIKRDASVSGFTATVIVQHDKKLIFPGDLAFSLVCRDSDQPSEGLEGMKSRISVVDPDPSKEAESAEVAGTLSAMSPTKRVTLLPPKTPKQHQKKQEL